MNSFRCFLLWLILLPGTVLAEATSQPASRPDGVFLGYANGPAVVSTTGFHKMIYQWEENGQKQQLLFSIYLPEGYGKDDRRWPMITFMAGLGDRGPDPSMGMAVGVPAAIGRITELQKWMPMIVLTPQCPGDKLWEAPDIAKDVVRLVHAVTNQFAVDSTRLYLTGFSNGGKGVWAVATQEPDLFAAAVPIVSREYQAEQTAQQFAGTGIALLAISGLADPISEPATSNMVAALRKQKVDVVYVPIPEAKHFVWWAFYTKKEFYDWLLLHRKGQAPPKDRPDADYFLKLYTFHQNSDLDQQVWDWRMQNWLNKLEPYWFIDNCPPKGNSGLRSHFQNRDLVLVTNPLSDDIPCRLQTTRQLPKDKITELTIEVGHLPKGQWELVIRVNEQEKLKTLVNDQTAPDGWLPVNLSLRDYAGGEARLQLIQNASGAGLHTAYWSKIKLVENPAP